MMLERQLHQIIGIQENINDVYDCSSKGSISEGLLIHYWERISTHATSTKLGSNGCYHWF